MSNSSVFGGSFWLSFGSFSVLRLTFAPLALAQGTLKLIQDGRGGYEFCSAGVHQYKSPWLQVLPGSKSIQADPGGQGWTIKHGDRTLTTVPQGFVGCTHQPRVDLDRQSVRKCDHILFCIRHLLSEGRTGCVSLRRCGGQRGTGAAAAWAASMAV